MSSPSNSPSISGRISGRSRRQRPGFSEAGKRSLVLRVHPSVTSPTGLRGDVCSACAALLPTANAALQASAALRSPAMGEKVTSEVPILDVQFLQRTVFDERHSRFLRRPVDKDVLAGHAADSERRQHVVRPAIQFAAIHRLCQHRPTAAGERRRVVSKAARGVGLGRPGR